MRIKRSLPFRRKTTTPGRRGWILRLIDRSYVPTHAAYTPVSLDELMESGAHQPPAGPGDEAVSLLPPPRMSPTYGRHLEPEVAALEARVMAAIHPQFHVPSTFCLEKKATLFRGEATTFEQIQDGLEEIRNERLRRLQDIGNGWGDSVGNVHLGTGHGPRTLIIDLTAYGRFTDHTGQMPVVPR